MRDPQEEKGSVATAPGDPNGPSGGDGGAGKAPSTGKRKPRKRARTSLLSRGEPMVWLTGGGLALSLVMIAGLLFFVFYIGMVTFWPTKLVHVKLHDGTVYMGEVTRTNRYEPDPIAYKNLSDDDRQLVDADMDGKGYIGRQLFRTGNFDLTKTHFHWVDDYSVAERTEPKWAVLLERTEWGRFYGIPTAFVTDGEVTADGSEAAWAAFEEEFPNSRSRFLRLYELKKHELGHVNHRIEQARLASREAELAYGTDSPQHKEAIANQAQVGKDIEADQARINKEIDELEEQNKRFALRLETASGQTKDVIPAEIVRAIPANQIGGGEKLGIYVSRWWEFLTDDPREANSEGGVFPAIFGTVLMTLIMTVIVVPFGVLAALYLREYAKAGPLVSVIRIAINNLAGVPSIVFGVFGLGFFCYTVGKWVDGGPSVPLTTPAWTATILYSVVALVLLVLAVIHRGKVSHAKKRIEDVLPKDPIGATYAILGLGLLGVGLFPILGTLAVILVTVILAALAFFVSRSKDPMTQTIASWGLPLLWAAMVVNVLLVVTYNPMFGGFYRAKLPNPTYGTGGLMWASLTLALLTLPVVIVATEEALSAVPRSMREGSYACGASKWQTIKRIVLPRAMPGIMTGTILAMARGAGEVAPLMLVGAVKLAPELPFDMSTMDGSLGFVPLGPLHPERSFMHLGFHIFDLGFQSQNSEAAKPMVYTTTLLLIMIVVTLNIAAIYLRSRMRRRFAGSQF